MFLKSFGSDVFNEAVMKERLPKETYKALKKLSQKVNTLILNLQNIVANAMKDWACEKAVHIIPIGSSQ